MSDLIRGRGIKAFYGNKIQLILLQLQKGIWNSKNALSIWYKNAFCIGKESIKTFLCEGLTVLSGKPGKIKCLLVNSAAGYYLNICNLTKFKC